MPRTNRMIISQDEGSYHIISRINKKNVMFNEVEKEYLFNLITAFASGFFVKIHAFCIMGTHFHILATNLDHEANIADKDELMERYKRIYGQKAKPPSGSSQTYGHFEVDEDGGLERLRRRLGSISRFMQELKQTFSVWYNKRHGLKGYLWHDRFKGIVMDKGEAQLSCSAYIDLNPVRANIVDRPEDYRWSSLGLRVRDAKFSREFLSPIADDFVWYREYVYGWGGVKVEGFEDKRGIKECFNYRVKNMSEGIAFGSYGFIEEIQRRTNRKFIRPRPFLDNKVLFTTRVLKSKK